MSPPTTTEAPVAVRSSSGGPRERYQVVDAQPKSSLPEQVEVVNPLRVGGDTIHPNRGPGVAGDPFEATEKSDPSPLGIHAKCNSQARDAEAAKAKATVLRFALQAGAGELMPLERIFHCLRTPHGADVAVMYSTRRQSAVYAGLQTCGSVWMCPICASKISERRRLELRAAIDAWSDRGGQVVHVTYTIRHFPSDELEASVDGLQAARTAAKTGRAAMEVKQRYGVVGSVRALEVTHGINGWHPHFHELLFIDAGSADLAAMEAELLERWIQVTRRKGLREVNEHGVCVHRSSTAAAEYLAKFGRERTWGPEHELTKQPVKAGREGSRSPVDLLRDYVVYGDDQAGALWRTYATTFKGRCQLAWSRGLRNLLLPELPEQTDEEIAADVSAYELELARLTRRQWAVILGNDARAEVLEVARTGDAAALWAYLRALGC